MVSVHALSRASAAVFNNVPNVYAGHHLFVVPVMEPETMPGTFSALNPHPNLPPVMLPSMLSRLVRLAAI